MAGPPLRGNCPPGKSALRTPQCFHLWKNTGVSNSFHRCEVIATRSGGSARCYPKKRSHRGPQSGTLVDLRGIELLTSYMPGKRVLVVSTNALSRSKHPEVRTRETAESLGCNREVAEHTSLADMKSAHPASVGANPNEARRPGTRRERCRAPTPVSPVHCCKSIGAAGSIASSMPGAKRRPVCRWSRARRTWMGRLTMPKNSRVMECRAMVTGRAHSLHAATHWIMQGRPATWGHTSKVKPGAHS
jgi:hypothetical protein